VRIIDYKTGKPDDHLKKIDLCDDLVSADCDEYLRQLVAYKLLFEKDKKESRGRRVEEGVLVFIEPLTANLGRLGYKKGEHVAKSVRINDDMVKQLGSVITKVWGQISELRFEKLPAHDKDICGRCDFAPICWEEA
jgi:CRISPR/Cas system-associated exonuclease Cas4 (RecB family)